MEKNSSLQRTMSKRYDVLLRLLLIGETGVGKTCVLGRYASEDFVDTHITTIGIDFKMKTLDLQGKTVKVQIWDTAGQERFESITKQFYRRAQGILLVYDITSRQSFEALPKWLNYIRQFGRDDVSIMVMRNKLDKEEKRQVTYSEGQKYATDNHLLFYETSAKDCANLEKAFYSLCENVLDKSTEKPVTNNNTHQTEGLDITQTESVKDTARLISEEGQKKWACCKVS